MKPIYGVLGAVAALTLVAASCGGGGAVNPQAGGSVKAASPLPTAGATPTARATATAKPTPTARPTPTATPTPIAVSNCAPGPGPTAAPASAPSNANLSVPAGFTIQIIANVGSARELASLPDGDLLVGTDGGSTFVIPNAEAAGAAGIPSGFTSIGDDPDNGVAFDPSTCAIYYGTQTGVYASGYRTGDRSAHGVRKIASVRTGAISPGSDGDVHHTTSVAFANGLVYAGVGSSCNACVEVDPTRASIQVMHPDGSAMTTRATRFRNAIALAVDPATKHVWAGGAGQDSLPTYHPYEFIDDLTSHAGVADYGWPDCEENHVAYKSGANCSSTVEPLVELPAYSTIIGATFYPLNQSGAYAFPVKYRGGLFITAHGSWHSPGGCNVPPRVAFTGMNADTPQTPVNWSDPTRQWTQFVGGFQPGCSSGSRIGRPTGIAVGSKGSLFVADDQTGNIYRIRP